MISKAIYTCFLFLMVCSAYGHSLTVFCRDNGTTRPGIIQDAEIFIQPHGLYVEYQLTLSLINQKNNDTEFNVV